MTIPDIIAAQLLTRLQVFTCQPQHILVVGCITYKTWQALAKLYPKAICIGLSDQRDQLQLVRDTQPWWKQAIALVQSAIDSPPFLGQTFDLIFSNLALQVLQGCKSTLVAFQRLLKPGGLLLSADLASDTQAGFPDPSLQTINPLQILGDTLITAKLTDVVVDIDNLTIPYTAVQAFKTEKYPLSLEAQFLKLRPVDAIGEMNCTVVYGQAWNAKQSHAITHSSRDIIMPIKTLKHRKFF
jgi:SAM-dependent methyltransferase